MIVFLDRNRNGSLDANSCGPNEDCLLRYIEPMPSGYTVRAATASNSITFGTLGEFSAGDKLFYFCSPSKAVADGYTTKISGSGSIGVSKGVPSCP